MTSANEGYDDERFETPVPQNLHCVICLNVLRKPMQCVRNEHSFCHPCITRHLQETPRCPTCIEPLKLQTLRPSRVVSDLLSQLRIHCDNADKGCPDVVKLEMLEAHIAQCRFSQVRCSNEGCELTVSGNDQRNHEMNNCSFRKGKCDVCGKEVPHGKRKLHCYVTRKEMDEMRHEMSNMKEIITNLSRELTRHMVEIRDELKEQMGSVNRRVNDLKQEMDEVKKKVHDIEEHSKCQVGLSIAGSGENWKVKNDIIIAGGFRLQSVEMFSWTTRQWTPFPPMTSARGCSSSFVHQGQMFVCGGAGSDDGSIEVLKLKEEEAQWKNFTGRLPQETWGHTSVVYENNLFIFGGSSNHLVFNKIYKVCLVSPYYCRLVGRMPEPRMYHGGQRFGDKLVFVGGTTTSLSSDSLDTVLLYDITNKCCQTLAPLPFAVTDMATVAWKDNIIIIGGRDQNNDVLNTVVVYNIRNQSSKMFPPMKHKRAECTAVITGNVIVVMGGWNKGRVNFVESFNFDLYEWEELPPMNEKRYGATAAVNIL